MACAGGRALADTYTYDRLGRLITVTYGDSTQIAYTYDLNGNITTIATGRNVGTAVEDRVRDGLPTEYALDQNYPNPFNPSTQIDYALPSAADVSLRVYDILGRPVATLVAEQQEPGWYSVRWDGIGASSGVYIARLTAGGFVAVRKMVLMR
jgi:YD repeat-containing protein